MLQGDFKRMRVGIIGAGMAGLSCADGLVAHGHAVTLFDKARGPGGRMSTRRMTTPLGEATFDHGAQYFTVRDPAFRSLVDEWELQGLVARWMPAGKEAWVGVPGMNAVIRAMVARHDTRYARMVQGIARVGGGWRLVGEQIEADPFDALVLALPAEQTAALLGPIDLEMARQAAMARSQPCWSSMFAFYAPLGTDRDVVRDHGPIGWAARNSAKPGREGPEAWVVQAKPSWSAAHLAAPPARIQKLMLAALAEALGIEIENPIASAAHRWLYALSAGSGQGALWNSEIGIGVCGDWLLGPRVECAWLSGRTLADAMAASMLMPVL